MDYADEQHGGVAEEMPPKIKAEENPWYLLATLYGVPEQSDRELREKNRIAWNRYFAANFNEATRARLIEEKRHPQNELNPFQRHELEEIKEAYLKRCASSPKHYPLPLSNAVIDFSNVQFDQDVSFDEYLFPDPGVFSFDCTFRDAIFTGRASFMETIFLSSAEFRGAIFYGDANFLGATFSGTADFSGVAFLLGTTFSYVTFSRGAFFAGATFSSGAAFPRAAFYGAANFNGAAFADFANFIGATFYGGAAFTDAMFEESASFDNTKMEFMTSFAGTTFGAVPPTFFGAELHQNTVWCGVKWPLIPRNKGEAGRYIDAYACLKLEMDRLKKHEDELDFFAFELQSRRVLLGRWGWGLPIWLYGLLCDYGRSYLRPLVALFVVSVIGALAFWFFDARTYGEALGLSVANALNVFGFRRDFGLTIDTPLSWLELMSAIQTILGTILVFLFGLGIRNKFRMK